MRVIGIDLGERRIGVAVSDASGTLARPLKTIERGTSDAEAVERLHAMIAELADEDEVGSVVVGLPTRLDGSPNPQTVRVSTMVALLSARLAIPVVTQDERLSSREAEERLSVREKDWRKRKAKLDAAAAAVILQDYLDARCLQGRERRAEGRVTRRGMSETAVPGCSWCSPLLRRWAWAGIALQTNERAVQGLRRSRAVRHDRAGQRHAHIGQRLIEAGVIRDDATFRAALWRSGRARSLQAGEFRFDRPMTPIDVIDKIARGDVYNRRITFPEGLNIREMARIYEQQGFGKAAAFVEAARDRGRDSRHRPRGDRSRGLSVSGNVLGAARHDRREARRPDGWRVSGSCSRPRCSRRRRRSS